MQKKPFIIGCCILLSLTIASPPSLQSEESLREASDSFFRLKAGEPSTYQNKVYCFGKKPSDTSRERFLSKNEKSNGKLKIANYEPTFNRPFFSFNSLPINDYALHSFFGIPNPLMGKKFVDLKKSSVFSSKKNSLEGITFPTQAILAKSYSPAEKENSSIGTSIKEFPVCSAELMHKEQGVLNQGVFFKQITKKNLSIEEVKELLNKGIVTAQPSLSED